MILNGNLKHTAAFSSFSTSSWHSVVLLCQEYQIAQIQASHTLHSEYNISQSFVRRIQIAYSTRKALLCAETIACEMRLNTIMPYGRHYILLLFLSPRNKENNFHHRCPSESVLCLCFLVVFCVPLKYFFGWDSTFWINISSCHRGRALLLYCHFTLWILTSHMQTKTTRGTFIFQCIM